MATSDQQSAAACNIRITSPYPQFEPLSFTFPLNTTIRELKCKITDALESKPAGSQQRLIYRGKILNDDSSIATVLGASANGEIIHSEPSGSVTFHLVLRPGTNSATPESTVAPPPYTNLPVPTAISSPSPDFTAYSTGSQTAPAFTQSAQIRRIGSLDPGEIRAQLAHMRAAARARVRDAQATQNVMATVRTSASVGSGEPSVAAPSTTTTTRVCERNPIATATGNGVRVQSTSGGSQITQPSSLVSSQSSIPERPLYLLQGPDGYLALLIPPDVSRPLTTPALANGLQFGAVQPPINPPEQNHLLPALNPGNFGMGAYYGQPAPQQPAPIPNPYHNPIAPPGLIQQNLAQQQQVHQALAQRPQLTPAELVQRLRERAGHMWLAMRLIIFVVLFSGGGGTRRTVTLGGLALAIFIWQTGILTTQITNLRALYNELFPPRPPRLTHAQQLRVLQMHQQQQRAGTGTTTAVMDPAITAQILINRDNERRSTRFREIYDGVERGLTIFLASLVPGMHERHVAAHEEREREREALVAAVNEAHNGNGNGIAPAPQGQLQDGGNNVPEQANGEPGQAPQQQEQGPDGGAMNNMAAEMLIGGGGLGLGM